MIPKNVMGRKRKDYGNGKLVKCHTCEKEFILSKKKQKEFDENESEYICKDCIKGYPKDCYDPRKDGVYFLASDRKLNKVGVW